jgi:pimeloyl-ACP methyl ester carboxylesterase
MISTIGQSESIFLEESAVIVELVQTWTADGLRLDGSYQGPSSPRRSDIRADAFCLVHGTGGNFYNSTLFDAVAERLLELGSAVLRVNTRGHDGISTAATRTGGQRLGAAYEYVDDCRKDLPAWAEWLRQRCGSRFGLIGHSLGAVKCLYAQVHEPTLAADCVVALSPPRLSYSWFCSSPEGPQFLETFRQAERSVQNGDAGMLLDVKLPLPYVITAAGFHEKYGPDERYNFLRFLSAVRCPVLVTLGSVEMDNNMAFRGAAEELTALQQRSTQLEIATIAGGDHFYTGVRAQLVGRVEAWLRGG